MISDTLHDVCVTIEPAADTTLAPSVVDSGIDGAHAGRDDATHQKLRKAVEKRERRYLWTPSDAIWFTPRLLPIFYGDGRALFALTTINQRPAYWVIRGCSRWGCGMDRDDAPGPDFGELVEHIVADLEDAFGSGRCGYSGNSLFEAKKDRIRNCQCEECTDGKYRTKWPSVDYAGGSLWSRTDWPKGFDTVENPLSWRGNLLAGAAAQ